MPTRKKSTKTKRSSKTLPFLILTFLVVLGFYFGIQYGLRITLNNSFTSQENLTRRAQHSKCINVTRKDGDFLLTYFVKPGDTLLSIAETQLGSTSRVNEIVALNKNKYNLSVQAPFLEQGWILYLPPQYVKSSSGNLLEESGEILAIDEATNEWTIGGKNSTTFHLKINNNTNSSQIENFAVGNCVKILYDINSSIVYKITPN